MRIVRRWGQQLKSDILLRKRVAEVKSALQEKLGLSAKPRLTRRGLHEHDNIYLVTSRGKTLGILRLANPHKKRKPLPTGMPNAALLDTAKRIEHEWTAYKKGSEAGLTPKPLWHAADALMCEYLPGRPLIAQIEKAPDKAWEILLRAARAVQKLHAAGLVHMDCCPQNMIGDALGNVYFIDFEYVPASNVPPPAQRVYDHLRLIETAWKFIPDGKKAEFGPWLEYFSGCLDDEMRHVKLKLLSPALPRILAAKDFSAALRLAFQH